MPTASFCTNLLHFHEELERFLNTDVVLRVCRPLETDVPDGMGYHQHGLGNDRW